jgi:hypothetical protein
LTLKDDELVLVGGSEAVNEVCDSYGMKKYVTVQEMAGIFPQLVPLSHKAHYPNDNIIPKLEERVRLRL